MEQVLDGRRGLAPRLPEIRADHQNALDEISGLITGYVPAPYPLDWVALKLLEGDAEITRTMQAALPEDQWAQVYQVLRQHDDALLAVASGRYEWIGRMVRAAVVQPKIGQVSLTQRLDRWAAHPVWGLVILAGILGLVFWLTFTIGAPIQAWLSTQVIGRLAEAAAGLLCRAPFWVRGLLVDGVIGGAGAVLTFLPIMVIFFRGLRPAGRYGLHGPGRLRDGQPDAPDGPARQVVPAAVPRIRLQCAGRHGHARDRFASRRAC